jgi:hypothetical protein
MVFIENYALKLRILLKQMLIHVKSPPNWRAFVFAKSFLEKLVRFDIDGVFISTTNFAIS